LSSLSASFVTDIYRPLIRKGASERHYLWVSRLGVVGFAVVLASLALACKPLDQILWVAFQVLAVTGGSTLGVFLLGLLTKRRANRANVLAMITSAVAMAVLLYLCQTGYVPLGWTWLIAIGTALTFSLGWLLGPVLDGPRPSAPPAL
jgi:Na+/proline symporter